MYSMTDLALLFVTAVLVWHVLVRVVVGLCDMLFCYVGKSI